MASGFIIYGLIDPRSGELRYVGQTRQPLGARLRSHVAEAKKGVRNHTYNWIRQLAAAGLRPSAEILENCTSVDGLEEAERHHIAYFNFVGCRLTNQTTGGEKATGWRPSEETKRKMSLSHLGKTPHNKGKHLSEAHKQSLSRAHMGKPLSVEHRRNLSAALYRMWSPDGRRRKAYDAAA